MNNLFKTNSKRIFHNPYLFNHRNFSQKVYKHITPDNTQEYHDKKEFENYKDNLHMNMRKPTSNIFSITPLYPDRNKSIDLMDERNVYAHEKIFQFNRFMKNRENDLKTIVNKKVKERKKHHLKTALSETKELMKQLEGKDLSDFGRELDKMKLESEKQYITKEDERNLRYHLEELTKKLGILDLREFIALNKFVIDADKHEDIINKIKTKFLIVALERMDENRRQEIKNIFNNIDRDDNISNEFKEHEKIESLFNYEENSKELFYRFYYQIKEEHDKDEQKSLSAEQRYEEMMKNLALKEKYMSYYEDENVIKNPQREWENDFDNYTDYIIYKYKEERTKKLKVTKEDVEEEIRKISHKKHDSWEAYERIFRMIKYFVFFQKYKKVYIPTNMEIERLIHKYTRDKRIKEFTRSTVYNEKDENFSDVSDDPDYHEFDRKDYLNTDSLAVPGLKTEKDDYIFDEETKNNMVVYDNMKKQYYKAKYHAKREEYIKNLDEEITNELGVIFASNAFDLAKDQKELNNQPIDELYNTTFNEKATLVKRKTKGGHFEFLDNLIDNYFAEAKLEYMYQFNDYFSDKYKIRKKISEEIGKRVSLKEVNMLLNKMVSEMRREFNDDLTRIPEFHYLNKDFTNHDFNIFSAVKDDYGEVVPDIYDSDQVASQNTNSVYRQIQDIKEKIEKEENKILDLEDHDIYEIEAYKAFKNDPVFKHYLHNHLSFFSEQLNDNFSTLPFAMKGVKPQDYIRYEKIKLAEYNKSKKEQASIELARKSDDMFINNNYMNNLSNSNNKEEVVGVTDDIKKKKRKIKYLGFGKRKRSQAVAEIIPGGSGKITINKKPFHHYFANPILRTKVMIPLVLADKIANVDVNINVVGGGVQGQLDAIIPALSKAFVKYNPNLKSIYKKTFCMVHDPRNVERKHPGYIKARKAYVFNKR